MHRVTLTTIAGIAVLLATGCGGPKYEIAHAQSEEDFLLEQEREGDRLKRQELENLDDVEGETDTEKNRKFDDEMFKDHVKHKADIAEHCPASAQAKDFEGGKFKVNITFDNEGKAKNIVVDPVPKNEQMYECLKVAFKLKLKPYTGPEQSRDYEFDLPSYADAAKADDKE